MDLCDTPAESDFRTGLRIWLGEQLPQQDPDGPPPELTEQRSRAWTAALYKAGYTGLTWPVEYGGRGLSLSYQAIFAEECALAGAPDPHGLIGLNMVGPTLIEYGTPAQKARHLDPILRGEQVFCQGFSEPEAGSDLAAVLTRAEAVPGGYRVTGEKLWSSFAGTADRCLLLVRTGTPAERHQGLTCLLLDLSAAGVSVHPIRQLDGGDGFGRIALADVFVPDDDVVGAIGGGWAVAMATLAHERGTFAIGLAARFAVQLDRLLATVRVTGRAGDPGVRTAVARCYLDLQALRHTGYRALTGLAAAGHPGPEMSILKLHWSQAHQRLSQLGWELLGPTGALDGTDAPWSGYWQGELLHSRGDTIAGGTSEILRGLVAERVVGLPRSR